MSARGGSRAEACPGGHIGPPLRGTGGVWEPTEISVKRSLSPAGRDGARPLRGTGGVRGGVRLGCGFRQPNFGTKFGASVMGIGPYALRGRGTPGSSCPTGGCGEQPRLPWVAAHSGVSAPAGARDGWESRQRPSPKGASNAGQSLSHGEAVTAPVVPRAWPPSIKFQNGIWTSVTVPKILCSHTPTEF